MNIKYTEQQLDELVKVLNTVTITGVDNIRAMAIAFQIIQSGQVEQEVIKEGAE